MTKFLSTPPAIASVSLIMKDVTAALRADRAGKKLSVSRIRRERNTRKVLRKYILVEITRKLENGEPLNLYLRNEIIQKRLPSMTISQIKKAKEDLSRAGIIYIARGGRQMPGKYPVWLLNFDFLNIKNDLPKKPARKFWAKSQGEAVEQAYEAVKAEVKSELQEAGVEVFPLTTFMKIVMKRLSAYLKSMERSWQLI